MWSKNRLSQVSIFLASPSIVFSLFTMISTHEFQSAKESLQALLDHQQTALLGSVDVSGQPEVSYAPILVLPGRVFVIYVSELAAHTANILTSGRASLMVIEDESMCATVFARRRATFRCRGVEVPRYSPEWKTLADQFQHKFAGVFESLRDMTDFHMIRLEPDTARVVLGFGQAFDLQGPKLEDWSHAGSRGGRGHKRESKV